MIHSIFFRLSLFLTISMVDNTNAQKTFCGNSPYFKFMFDDENRDCRWLRSQSDEDRFNICKNTDIQSKCKYSCGLCCEDNPNYRLQLKDGARPCRWIAMEVDRIDTYCDLSTDPGSMQVKYFCPITCDYCPKHLERVTDQPSLSPTILVPSGNSPDYFNHAADPDLREGSTTDDDISNSLNGSAKSPKPHIPFSGLSICAAVIALTVGVAFVIHKKKKNVLNHVIVQEKTQVISEPPQSKKEEPITPSSPKSIPTVPSVIRIEPPKIIYIVNQEEDFA